MLVTCRMSRTYCPLEMFQYVAVIVWRSDVGQQADNRLGSALVSKRGRSRRVAAPIQRVEDSRTSMTAVCPTIGKPMLALYICRLECLVDAGKGSARSWEQKDGTSSAQLRVYKRSIAQIRNGSKPGDKILAVTRCLRPRVHDNPVQRHHETRKCSIRPML